MCFPTAVSIVTATFAQGKARNIAFSCQGFGQPLGFQVGLVLSGVFADSSVTWRFAFYLCAGATMLFFGISCWCLPQDRPREPLSWVRLAHEIDWIGILISSISLGFMSYVFAYVSYLCLNYPSANKVGWSIITGSISSIHDATNIALLSMAGALALAFVLWMHLQEKRGKPALIPNSLWKKMAFSSICLMVLMTWAVQQSIDYFFSLL